MMSVVGPRDRTLRRTCGYCGYGWRHRAYCPVRPERSVVERLVFYASLVPGTVRQLVGKGLDWVDPPYSDDDPGWPTVGR